MVVAKQNASNTLAYILLVLVLAALFWWSYTHLNYRIEEVDKGYQGEAVTNPFLAAEYFLRRMGQKAEKIKLFTDLPGDQHKPLADNDTLMVPGNRIAFDRRRSAKLMEWVQQGGHLIVTGKAYKTDEYVSHDYILDPLGLVIDWQIDEDDSLDEKAPADLDIKDEDDFWQVDFINYQVISYVENFNQAQISQDIIWSIESDGKLHAIQLRLGAGKLTVLSDMKMFRSDYIDEYDHAAFLLSLANDQVQASQAGTFYYSLYEDHISLFQWLWDNAYPLMVSLLICGFIVLWMLIPRFGPLINIHQPVRRRFLDHLSASGNYHWRQGHYSRLLTEVRKQLSLQIKVKYPEWTNLSKQDQLTHLAEVSQLESPVIEQALFDMKIERIDDFVKKIKILEKLRKSL